MRTRKLIPLFLFVCSLLAFGQLANAQERKLSSTPKAFQAFYAKFRSAMVRNDKVAVAAMTKFPFHFGFDAGNEGSVTRTQFLKRFNKFFGSYYRGLFKQRNPVFQFDAGTYDLVSDDATHFRFDKVGTGYKFAARMSEP